jgi:hypothetical protein
MEITGQLQAPTALNPRRIRLRYQPDKRNSGAQSCFGRSGETKNLLPLRGLEPLMVHPFNYLTILSRFTTEYDKKYKYYYSLCKSLFRDSSTKLLSVPDQAHV